jgi:autotransporter passenger strand-loop-strand repeat protein
LAISDTIGSGGQQFISNGGSAVDVTVSSGGYAYVSAGGTMTSTTLDAGGVIELAYIPNDDTPFSTSFDSGTDMLTVFYGDGSVDLQMAGDYTGEYFHASAGNQGIDITVDGTPCYCGGTAILTDKGERPVEALAIGDRLVTKSGAARPIKWIGRRSYSGVFARGKRDILPVTIRQGALDGVLPHRDLHVSPLHALFIDGVLIPARALVNGVSIVQADRVERVDYFHLELETHDVIYAEGAAAESFVDDDSRSIFHNAAEYGALYPAAARGPARYCAPMVEDGAALENARRRIAGFAHALAA